MPATISINRAPVLTLWAAVVAQRLGFRWDESLSLGKALAGLNAQAKGRRLGIFKPHEEKTKAARERERGEQFWIELCGRPVTAESAEAYLETKFGDHLEAARAAMTTLAHAYRPRELAAEAFALYEAFRPAVAEGVKGWGAKGDLDLRKMCTLAKG